MYHTQGCSGFKKGICDGLNFIVRLYTNYKCADGKGQRIIWAASVHFVLYLHSWPLEKDLQPHNWDNNWPKYTYAISLGLFALYRMCFHFRKFLESRKAINFFIER